MTQCKTINRGSTKICIGTLDTLITVHVRSIAPPKSGSTDFDLNFTSPEDVWANVETVSGKTIFDGTNIERVITHIFRTRYFPGVTEEAWVELNSQYYDIVNVEDIDEKNEWLVLRCNIRGTNTKPVNFA